MTQNLLAPWRLPALRADQTTVQSAGLRGADSGGLRLAVLILCPPLRHSARAALLGPGPFPARETPRDLVRSRFEKRGCCRAAQNCRLAGKAVNAPLLRAVRPAVPL